MPRELASHQHREALLTELSRPPTRDDMPQNTSRTSSIRRAVDEETPDYLRRSGDEGTNPSLVDEARRIHAEGYLAAGFVNHAEPVDPGHLSAAWSMPTGCDARYYVVVNANDAADRATARQLRPASGQGYGPCPDSASASMPSQLREARFSKLRRRRGRCEIPD